ncbi:regulatory protein RecX [Arsukibacterium sp.]|uniref:regulatory protein RecX n=1 Tax=Arsukibacterium sp. TaxID=1977258 RepID=UPI002FDAA788
MPELKDLQQQALQWLSRRDHSAAQLRQKLQEKGASPEQLTAVVDWSMKAGYLDEQRFLTMLVRTRSRQGYGYRYLQQECRQHQLDEQLLSAAVAEQQLDWWQLAAQCYNKKFGDKPCADFKDKQKRMAYLQRRGFSYEQINAIFNP